MKLDSTIAAERKEAKELAARILDITRRIPQHVINTPGVVFARQFKAEVAQARQAASASNLNVQKLRTAMQQLNFYYREPQ